MARSLGFIFMILKISLIENTNNILGGYFEKKMKPFLCLDTRNVCWESFENVSSGQKVTPITAIRIENYGKTDDPNNRLK